MSDATARATDVIGEVSGLSAEDLSITVNRAEGDAMSRQNTVVLARDVTAAEAAGYPRHRWCVVTPRNIKIRPRGMQARFAVAVDLTDGELTEMLVHDLGGPGFPLGWRR